MCVSQPEWFHQGAVDAGTILLGTFASFKVCAGDDLLGSSGGNIWYAYRPGVPNHFALAVLSVSSNRCRRLYEPVTFQSSRRAGPSLKRLLGHAKYKDGCFYSIGHPRLCTTVRGSLFICASHTYSQAPRSGVWTAVSIFRETSVVFNKSEATLYPIETHKVYSFNTVLVGPRRLWLRGNRSNLP